MTYLDDGGPNAPPAWRFLLAAVIPHNIAWALVLIAIGQLPW